MGSQESKLEEPSKQDEHRIDDEAKESALNDSVPSTPILTPLDPRSPSVNIARTPLDLILGSKINEDSPDPIEQDVVEENTEDCVNLVLGIDPRSPTVEFNRTPIIIATVTKQKSLKPQNKNLDNVRKSLIQITPRMSTGKPSKIVPPKLLGSSPISTIPNSEKRKSFVGLLETNIDFTETDLDSVCKAMSNMNRSLPIEVIETTPLTNKLKNQMDVLHIEPETEFDLGLIETQSAIDENEVVVNGSPEIEESVSDTEFKVEQVDSNDDSPEEKTVNITAHVKDFDKKLTNLIYQDDSEDDNKVSLRFAKIRENNRTPLGVRNSNDEPKKTVSKLKVSDKPRKSEISKIPVFKDNHGKKVGIQCENTPPIKMEEKRIKPRKSQWDADKTLII